MDCTMKIFLPRTFWLIWMLISLSLNWPTVAGCSSTPRYWQMDSARGRLPLPEKMLRVREGTGGYSSFFLWYCKDSPL